MRASLQLMVVVPLIVLAIPAESTDRKQIKVRGLLHRLELAPVDKLGFEAMSARAVADLQRVEKEESGKAPLRLIRISYFTTQADRSRTASGKGAVDVSYEYWRALYKKYGSDPPAMADVIKFGGAAALRYRSGRTIEVVPLVLAPGQQARNPLHISEKRGTFDILELIVDPDGEIRCYAKFTPSSGVQMDKIDAVWLGRRLATELGTNDIYVSLRTDVWFIKDSEFPIAYRFDVTNSVPPDAEKYKKSRLCTAFPGDINPAAKPGAGPR